MSTVAERLENPSNLVIDKRIRGAVGLHGPFPLARLEDHPVVRALVVDLLGARVLPCDLPAFRRDIVKVVVPDFRKPDRFQRIPFKVRAREIPGQMREMESDAEKERPVVFLLQHSDGPFRNPDVRHLLMLVLHGAPVESVPGMREREPAQRRAPLSLLIGGAIERSVDIPVTFRFGNRRENLAASESKVTVAPEMPGHGLYAGKLSLAPAVLGDDRPVASGIDARQDAGSRRRAKRNGCVRVQKCDSLARELLEMRGGDNGLAPGPFVERRYPAVHVVDRDEQDVGSRGLNRTGRQGGEGAQEQHHQNVSARSCRSLATYSRCPRTNSHVDIICTWVTGLTRNALLHDRVVHLTEEGLLRC